MECPHVFANITDTCKCVNNGHCPNHCPFCLRYAEVKGCKRSVREVDPIMWWCDEMFLAGEFDSVNHAITNINTSNLAINEMLTWLTCTMWADNKLPYRKTFFKKCEKILLVSEGPERTAELVRGLRSND